MSIFSPPKPQPTPTMPSPAQLADPGKAAMYAGKSPSTVGGFSSTILTSPTGVKGTPSTTNKSLLGQ